MSNESPFFSIIVPIYNAEDYLEECIESVINQTYTSWELLLVDDGSTDSSYEICMRYARVDGRIYAFHKNNGGEFSSRLFALQNAKGIYVTGLDADDFYELDYLQTIKNEIDTFDYDCIMWSFTQCGEKNGIIPLKRDLIKEYTGSEYLLMVAQTTLHSFCSKAIKLEIFQMIDFEDTPKVRMSEDYIMVIPALCKIKNAKVIDYYGYNYRIRTNSTSHSVTYQKLQDMCEVSRYGLKVMAENGFGSEEYVRGEATAFLNSLMPRIWQGIRENTLTDKEIIRILNNDIYKNSVAIVDNDTRRRNKIDELYDRYIQASNLSSKVL